MTRQEALLAAFGAARNTAFTPVQLQKMMFLLEKTIAQDIGGPFFAFQPYHYGPFDADVYHEFGALERSGYGETLGNGSYRQYRLTQSGKERAEQILEAMDERRRAYMLELAQWIQTLSFSSLVSSIYKAYPEMRANSVFKG